jgi:glycosyltransferase involved in cell wall biosynthesis
MEFEILTANYNNSKFLGAFFDSIMKSSIKPASIIIVDDCSNDNSVEIIRSYADKININLIINENNIGFANSLNVALKELVSPYFARLDSDDEVHAERFLKQLVFLEQNPEIDIVGSNVGYILNGKFKKNSDVIVEEKEIFSKIRNGILPIIHGTIMGKSKVFKEFKYKQEFVPSEDYDLFAFAISEGYRVTNIVDTLTYVTIHENSVSNGLKFLTIKKRFFLAKKYFNFNKTLAGSYLEYLHQLYYRKYLIESTSVKYYYLIISAFSMPIKTFKKALKYIYS